MAGSSRRTFEVKFEPCVDSVFEQELVSRTKLWNHYGSKKKNKTESDAAILGYLKDDDFRIACASFRDVLEVIRKEQTRPSLKLDRCVTSFNWAHHASNKDSDSKWIVTRREIEFSLGCLETLLLIRFATCIPENSVLCTTLYPSTRPNSAKAELDMVQPRTSNQKKIRRTQMKRRRRSEISAILKQDNAESAALRKRDTDNKRVRRNYMRNPTPGEPKRESKRLAGRK